MTATLLSGSDGWQTRKAKTKDPLTAWLLQDSVVEAKKAVGATLSAIKKALPVHADSGEGKEEKKPKGKEPQAKRKAEKEPIESEAEDPEGAKRLKPAAAAVTAGDVSNIEDWVKSDRRITPVQWKILCAMFMNNQKGVVDPTHSEYRKAWKKRMDSLRHFIMNSGDHTNTEAKQETMFRVIQSRSIMSDVVIAKRQGKAKDKSVACCFSGQTNLLHWLELIAPESPYRDTPPQKALMPVTSKLDGEQPNPYRICVSAQYLTFVRLMPWVMHADGFILLAEHTIERDKLLDDRSKAMQYRERRAEILDAHIQSCLYVRELLMHAPTRSENTPVYKK